MGKRQIEMKYTTNEAGNLVLEFISNINIDNGITIVPQGKHTSTMELFMDDNGVPKGIEWDNPVDTVWIGLWFEDRELVDYDGVFELPPQAIKLLRKAGFVIPKYFEYI